MLLSRDPPRPARGDRAGLRPGSRPARGTGSRRRRRRRPSRTRSGSPPTPHPPRARRRGTSTSWSGSLVGGEARAYPVNLLWGESAHTVNDDLGRTPIAVALCPLAGVAAAFDRRHGKETLEIGHVSEVRLDTLVLYDARTRSRWGLADRRGVRGAPRGPEARPPAVALHHLGPLEGPAPRDERVRRPGGGGPGIRARRRPDPARRPRRGRAAPARRLGGRARGPEELGGLPAPRAREGPCRERRPGRAARSWSS